MTTDHVANGIIIVSLGSALVVLLISVFRGGPRG